MVPHDVGNVHAEWSCVDACLSSRLHWALLHAMAFMNWRRIPHEVAKAGAAAPCMQPPFFICPQKYT